MDPAQAKTAEQTSVFQSCKRTSSRKYLSKTSELRDKRLLGPHGVDGVAVNQEKSIPVTDMDNVCDEYAADGDPVQELQDKVHQLYSVLMQVTETEANDTVCNDRTPTFNAHSLMHSQHIPSHPAAKKNSHILLSMVADPVEPGHC